MASSPGGNDRPADSDNAPDNKNNTHPSGGSATRPASSVTSRSNTSEFHSPAVRFNVSETAGYMSMFAGLQAVSKSCENPDGTISLPQIENQNHFFNQSYSEADNDVAAADNTIPLADKPDALMPIESKVKRQVFDNIEDAANSSTDAPDKVGKYVRARGEKKLKLESHQRRLDYSRELIKQCQADEKNDALTEKQRFAAREHLPIERETMLKHLDNVHYLQDSLRMEKRDEASRRMREGGPDLSEPEEDSDDNKSEYEDSEIKEELIDDGFTPVPAPDNKRRAADKVDGAAKPKKLKATDEANNAVKTGKPKVSKKAAPSLRQSVLTPKEKEQGEYVDPGTDSEPEDESTADKTDTDTDSKSKDSKGKGKAKRKERAISATNPKRTTWRNGIPIPEWDEPQRGERSRSNKTVKSYAKGNEHADKNAGPRQRKDALAVIDNNTIALSDGREPASYRSSPHKGNYDCWNIIFLQCESYGLAMKSGSAQAMKTLKNAGGSLEPLSNTEHAQHEQDVKEAVENLQELYKAMKLAADNAAAKADNKKGSQSKLSAAEASAKKKRATVWGKLKKSNLSKSLDGASDFDGDCSATSTVG